MRSVSLRRIFVTSCSWYVGREGEIGGGEKRCVHEMVIA